jgi:hypothetical protein
MDYNKARMEAEAQYPFLSKFRNVRVVPARGDNLRGLGEYFHPKEPSNPNPGEFTISIGSKSKDQPGGVASTIIADMVHAAGDLSPEFRKLKSELIQNLSAGEINFARKKFEEKRLKHSGENFSNFEKFMENYWSDGIIQHLLIPHNSEIDEIKRGSPGAVETLNKIKALFEGK